MIMPDNSLVPSPPSSPPPPQGEWPGTRLARQKKKLLNATCSSYQGIFEFQRTSLKRQEVGKDQNSMLKFELAQY